MTRALVILLLLAGVAAHAASLEYDYDGEITPSLAIHFRQSQDLSIPIEQWQTIGVVTNVQAFSNSVPVSLTPPRMFFVAVASNEWGLASSEVLRSAPPGQTRIRIR